MALDLAVLKRSSNVFHRLQALPAKAFRITGTLGVSIFRLAVISSAALGAATFTSWFDYKFYRDEIALRSQTIEFNILSHTLPTKLSYALQQENWEEMQRTLDSNYGIFGLVVTNCKTPDKDCPEQYILLSSQSKQLWKVNLKLADLQKHPYDLLRSPPPLFAENQYNPLQAREPNATGRTNPGEIVGRVYYIRSNPPRFLEDYWQWIQNPLIFRDSSKNYSLTAGLFLIGGLATWVGLEFGLYKQRIQATSRRQSETELELERTSSERKEYQFRKEIRKITIQRDELFQQKSHLENTINQLQAKSARDEQFITELQNQLTDLETQSERNQYTIVQLQSQLIQTQTKRQRQQQKINQQQRELQENQSLRQKMDEVCHREEQSQKEINELLEQLVDKEKCERLLTDQVDALKAEKHVLIEQLKQTNEKIKHFPKNLTDESRRKESVSSERYTLRLDGIKVLGNLQSREFKQLITRIIRLPEEPRPHDCRPLNKYNLRNVYSIDEGEFRICYTIHKCPEQSSGEIQVLMIGRRNDDEIYKALRRLIG